MKANAGNMKHFWAYKKKRLDACVSANSHNGWINNKDKDASYIEQQCNSAGAHRIWFTSEPLEVLCNKKSTMRCSLMHRLYKVSSFAAGRLTSLKPTMWLFKTFNCLIWWQRGSKHNISDDTTFKTTGKTLKGFLCLFSFHLTYCAAVRMNLFLFGYWGATSWTVAFPALILFSRIQLSVCKEFSVVRQMYGGPQGSKHSNILENTTAFQKKKTQEMYFFGFYKILFMFFWNVVAFFGDISLFWPSEVAVVLSLKITS